MSTCDHYLATRYLRDLARFRLSYARVLGRNPADLPSTPPLVVNILEGHREGVSHAIERARISDPLLFLILTFTEGALLAGVHAYDLSRYSQYVQALPITVFIERFPSMTMIHPQSALAAHPNWTPRDLAVLEECVASLTARWALAYDEVIAGEHGAGQQIVDALGRDRDLAWGCAAEIDERVAAAYMTGLRRAAEEAAGA